MALTTTGWHRVGNVTSRSSSGLDQQVVPGATIYVTSTLTTLAATIYSDPLLSAVIPLSTLTADIFGNYDYYLPLNYCVTETISAPNGGLSVTANIAQNGPLVTSLTTTASASDTVTLIGILSTSHVSITPTNAAAAAMIASIYVSAKSAGSITVTHTASAGATFDIIITPY